MKIIRTTPDGESEVIDTYRGITTYIGQALLFLAAKSEARGMGGAWYARTGGGELSGKSEVVVYDLDENVRAVYSMDWNADYQVIVGNIGLVHQGADEAVARVIYDDYVDQSNSGVGRAGDEIVTLIADDEILAEHAPDAAQEGV